MWEVQKTQEQFSVASHGYQQCPYPGSGAGQGRIPVQGLPRRQPLEGDAAGGGGIHPTFFCCMCCPKACHRSFTSCDCGISPSLDVIRIRHYGFLANACRAKQLPRIRRAIEAARRLLGGVEAEEQAHISAKTVSESWCFTCPICHGPMRILAEIPPGRVRFEGG